MGVAGSVPETRVRAINPGLSHWVLMSQKEKEKNNNKSSEYKRKTERNEARTKAILWGCVSMSTIVHCRLVTFV